MPLPMPTDFAIRLACGLCAMLLVISPRSVPPAFFRTVCLIAMALLVAAGLTAAGAIGRVPMLAILASAVVAYLASALWGLGLPRVAIPATLAIVALGCVLLVGFAGGSAGSPRMALNAASRGMSAALMGASLAAMLLGHHYLTAPAMSIDPLRRFVAAMSATLAARAVLAAIALAVVIASGSSPNVDFLFVAMRWGMGIVGPAVASAMTWQTVRLRSTQSATGILYIAVTLVLFGELSGMILGHGVGVEL